MTWEYIAGFFDGEGSVTHNGKGFRVTVPQTQLLVLQKIRDFLGCGRVIQVTKRRPHWKQSWVLCLYRQEEVWRFLQGVRPFTIVKARQIASTSRVLEIRFRQTLASKATRVKVLETARRMRKCGASYRTISAVLKCDHGSLRKALLKG